MSINHMNKKIIKKCMNDNKVERQENKKKIF